MREILKEIKDLQFNGRGCRPKLRGACPIGRDDGGRSYVAQMVGRSRPNWRRRGSGGILGAGISYLKSGQWLVWVHSSRRHWTNRKPPDRAGEDAEASRGSS